MNHKKHVLLYVPEDNSKNVTVEKYEEWRDAAKAIEIADFLYERHFRRYLKPFTFDSQDYKSNYKNGFSMMASYCLLIETIEGFYRGWPKSRNELAFMKFFTRDKHFTEFAVSDIPSQFYKNIRCGILHQGETSGGWLISRNSSDPLISNANKTINANKFGSKLQKSLEDYTSELKQSDWNSELWKHAKERMKSLIKNCA
ncbi:MAG: hypothetical protein KZQ73_03335 [Candidatus Thiodiazotropha sp. (ex Semelilucina semeliformis)]|nr:hypothetical protein [Candidatus Thiodiazotropha sp. (ex Semelilucina semeliformis)]